jgi:hypothetical protein
MAALNAVPPEGSRLNYAACLPALFFAAQRAFIIMESFLRPAAVNPTLLSGFALPARNAACRRFIPSEIRLRAATLIVRLFLGSVVDWTDDSR